MTRPQRFLILPAQGLESVASTASSLLSGLGVASKVAELKGRLHSILGKSTPKEASSEPFHVVASMADMGVSLVETTEDMLSALRFEHPGLRAVPEYFYRPALFRAKILRKAKAAAGVAATVAKKLVISIVHGESGKPLAGVDVVGFVDFAAGTGSSGTTNSKGQVTLSVPGSVTRFERLYVQHEIPGLWSHFSKSVVASGVLTIPLAKVDLAAADSLRHFHKVGATLTAGKGVRVGVIDSGVDTSHPDLKVAGGLGCVPGSPEDQFGPNGVHGTHVAGIIAGRGTAPTGMRGIAPGASIFSYRVFDDTDNSGSTFGLVKAIRQGIKDKCDLLNMSLGFDGDPVTGKATIDAAIQEAIQDARAAGIVVVAAAGNDGRKPVNYPAADDLALAVSAIGRKETFPPKSGEAADAIAPFGTDPKDFLAAFSNIGPELDLAGAGVGVVSTVPGGHMPLSGTSMACPAVTGVIARLLSENSAVLKMPRNAARSDAIKALVFANAKSLGFTVRQQGRGLPR